ncbi:hypothetical protein Poli38472_004403 [Pythium oligandrum]|uniref:F-box domain-containing protein n=1 Tax=Pythium oligandrum TaxID=41045 RepID=A0A8K1C9R7_PYTOL|nr:hypothetical protein Poli38472_004403 [Pythium oligandrum]|eukprot:TMW59334.1 hypothetical protein Poli38472_004403 [Pythium oligandrum]
MTPSQAKTTLGGFADDFSTLLTPFLTGVELFALSHVDRSFYRQLSGEDVWNDRIRQWSPRPPQSARAPVMPRCWQKHAYAKSRCVLSVPYDPSKGFDGKRVPRDLATWLSPQFDYTVDVFFCLLPQYLQDPLAKEVNLHVSLNHQVTVRVQPGRWYHLGWNLDEIETVYFNGTAIAQNARTDEHMFVWDGELRTNFFGLSQRPREATSKACFAMHGLVHTMRYWSSCFHSHIERLAQLEDLGINPLSKIQVTYDALGRPDQGEFSSQPHEKTGVLSTLSKFYPPRPAPLVPRAATNTSTMPPPTQITSTATGFQMEWVLTVDDLARLGLLPLLQGQGDQANQPPQQQQAPPAQQPGQPTQLAGFTDGLMVLLRPFLVGVDLLTLSHVSYRFYRQLSWDDTWRPRVMWWSPPKQLPVQQPPMLRCWEKQSYAQSRCLLSMPYEPTSNFAFDQARVGMDYTCTFQTQFNYTVDCWFCLLPQYVKRNEDGNVPEFVELYCSINQRTRLRLQPGRWYHIAWDLADVETVYLNGAPVTSSLRTSAHYFAWDGELRSNFFGAAPSSFPYDAKATFAMHGLFLTIRYWANVYNGLISGNAAMRDMGIKPTFQIQAEYDAQGRAKYGELCSQPHEMFGYLSTKSKYHPRNTIPLAQEPVVPVILPAQEPASVVVPLQTASAPATEPKTTQKADLSIHLKPEVAKNSSTKVINQPVYGFADGFVELLTPYLLGVDLLPLSYVSRAFHRQLSSASVWTPRIHDSSRPHPQQPANHHLTWCWQKQAYAETRSMLSKPWPMSALSLFSTNTAIVPSPYLVTSLDM